MNLKTARFFRTGLLTALLSASIPALAYKEGTHTDMSWYIAKNSVLSQIGKLNDLGLMQKRMKYGVWIPCEDWS
jgi:hypothetical protein